jgi:type II secretory pathway component GspD/PulD (secretin)
MSETKPKRRWFSFSIRDLLLLTVIVALSVGWWLDHRKLTKDNSIQLSMYFLHHIDANQARGTLLQTYAGDSDVSISIDARQNALVVRAPAKQNAELDLLLKQLDVASTSAGNQSQVP